MRKLITLGFCLFFIGSAFGQKLDYDRDSKWFFGFNVGGTWNTTDVRNRTNFGWGLILGRSFNYNYGKKVSFDLRLRYLGGNWYGQDFDTTNVSGNPLYDPASELVSRYDSLGYTVNNFNTEAHELGLELVLHLNSLREKTGWDPYIFGGIGAAWSQTNGDLYSQDAQDTASTLFYQYAPGTTTKAELNQLTDGIYDTPLDGSGSGYSVTIVPSLGIGLAYQVGPKFSIGLEHRTMFSLRNTFDGYQGTSKKWGLDNDLYHYSGLSMKFNIGKRVDDVSTNTNTNGVVAGGGCENPEINFQRPNQRVINIDTPTYTVEAIVKEVAGRENIQFFVNGNLSTNFTYNASNDKFQSTVALNPGENTFVIKASNACGTDEERVTINYSDCTPPQVDFIRPAGNSISVEQATYVINATVINADNIEYQINGLNSNNYSLSGNTFTSNLRLQNGMNTIRIIARNECGVDEQTVQINYVDCTPPAITLLTGSGNITVTEPVYTLSATIANIVGRENVQFLVNGANATFNYNASTRKFQSSIALNPGVNTLQIIANNDCANDTETITVNYSPCVQPVISFIQPAGGSVTVNTTSTLIRATIQNVTAASQIQLRVNGVVRAGGSFNSVTKIFEQTISLIDGDNIVEIRATNECGSEVKTTRVIKQPCVGPQLSMVQPSSLITSQENASLLFKAMVSNVTSTSQIKLFLNGISIFGGTYNSSTRIFQKSLNLNPGNNTIKLIATNDCSSQELVYTVTYRPCTAPEVTMVSPAASTSTSNPTTQVSALVTNVSSANQIILTVNGMVVSGGTYNSATKLFTKSIALAQGVNTITVKATNDCGQDQQSVTAAYTPCLGAEITMIAPSTVSSTVENSSYNIQATIQNVTSSNQIQVTLNGSSVGGGTLNASTSLFQKNITLSQGTNTITITANNDCGAESETFVILYEPCLVPIVTMLQPVGAVISTDQQNLTVKAKIENVQLANQIVLKVNGVVVPGGLFNPSTMLFENTISLTEGVNTINIMARTNCGQDFEQFTVNYEPCKVPEIAMINPTGASVESPTGSLLVSAMITNAAANQISLTVNGATVGGGSYNASTGQYQNTINVHSAQSTAVLTVVTDCGQASQTFVITHEMPCDAPTLTMVNPTTTIVNSTTGQVQINALVTNALANQIVLTVDGAVVNGGSFNATNGQYQNTVNVQNPSSNVLLKVSNDCGQAMHSFVIKYEEPCDAPKLIMISPVSPTVNSSTGEVEIKATINNAMADQIVLTVNGNTIAGGSYSVSTGLYQNIITVQNPSNTVILTVSNDCGQEKYSFVVKYEEPCTPPTLTMISPLTPTIGTAVAEVEVKATINNVLADQIVLTVNGSAVAGGSYNASTGLYQNTAIVQDPTSNVVLTVTNDCGQKQHSFLVKYEQPCDPPKLTMVSPTAPSISSTTGEVEVKAIIENANASQITLLINGTAVPGGSYNASNGRFQQLITVADPTSTILLKVLTECGKAEHSFIVKYEQPCNAPVINIQAPTSTNITTEQSSISIQASVQNVGQANQVGVMVNGTQVPGGNFNPSTGIFTQTIQLSEGLNTIKVGAQTDCGREVKTIIVSYKPCKAPEITMVNPTGLNTTSTSGTLLVQANIANATANEITMTVNGVQVSGGSFNATTGLYQNNITVHELVNTVVLTVNTTCGQVSQTFVVNHTAPCDAPSINITAPTSSVTTNSSVNLQALIQNVNSINQIILKVNGVTDPGGAFNPSSGIFQRTINLSVGNNTVTITAQTACGIDNKQLVIKRNEEQKITICHYPPGNTGNPQQIEIPLSAWPAHQAHGDVIGPCPTTGGNSQTNPTTGTGATIGGSENGNNGTVTGQGNSGNSGNNGNGNNGGGEENGGGRKSEETGGKVTTKPKETGKKVEKEEDKPKTKETRGRGGK